METPARSVLVIYATREGHSARIAEYIANAVHHFDALSTVYDVKDLPSSFSLAGYHAAFLIASVHRGEHENEIVEFVKGHRAELERLPTVFLSVSLSEMSAEDQKAPPELRAEAKAEVRRVVTAFLDETEWKPSRVQAVAGALAYKWISSDEDGATTAGNFTDWNALATLVREFMANGLAQPLSNPADTGIAQPNDA